MICFLFHWLNQQLASARVRNETHEAARIELVIELHQDKCVICAGVEPLANNLFGQRVEVTE